MIEMTNQDWKMAQTVHVHFADPENEWSVMCHLQKRAVQHSTDIDPMAVTCPYCQQMPEFQRVLRIAQYAFNKSKAGW